jgi:putative oxidoreductase
MHSSVLHKQEKGQGEGMAIGLLLLRVTVGLTLAAHGVQKLFGWFGGYGPDGTGRFLESLGFFPGKRHAVMAGAAETLGGLLLAVGLLTPLAAVFVISVMFVAVAAVHISKGFFVFNNGYEYNLVLSVAALAVAFTGPGALSLDALFGLPLSGGLWGAAALIGGVAGGAFQMAQRRQTPAAQAAPLK